MKYPFPVSDKTDISLTIIIITQNAAEGEEEQLEAMRAEWRGTEQLRRHYERAQMILRGEETGLLEQIGHLERALELLRGELSEELQKTEQYVDMALQYLRLDSASSDFVFKEYSLDDILKQALREYSGMFIRKRIALNYRQTGITVVTDEKWLLFVIGQILSNALKYTDSGKISIYTQVSEAERPSELNAEDGGPLGEVPVPGDEESRGGGTAPSEDSCPEPAGIFLVIEDTGIGIAPEDLYRVFEKGFTGYNGRENKKATGLGLYLCRRILDKLSHTIEIESEPGRGTKVKIGLERYEVKGE